jgi:hypothetical protein
MDDQRIIYSFKWGFLSDRIVEIIKKYEIREKITDEDKITLGKANNLFEMIISGEKQANTGKFSMNALEDLKLYNRSKEIFDTTKFFNELSDYVIDKKISEIMLAMQKTINDIISENENIDVKNVKNFFNSLQKLTVDEGRGLLEDLYEQRDSKKWGLLGTVP